MKKQQYKGLDFIIDKLTNSIENVQSGDSFPTEISILTISELKNNTKKSGWRFNWGSELKAIDREVYKLTIANNPNIIQGIISLEVKEDHVYMHLIESAKFNKGKSKIYLGVPGNLVAFACKHSYDKGYDGYVAFDSKTKLIQHYQDSLGAKWFKGTRMYLDSLAAIRLINQYF